MERWLKVVKVLGEVSPEEANGEIQAKAWKFKGVEIREEIVEVEGEKPEVGDVVEFFPDDPILSLLGLAGEVIEVIREVEPNVWEVKVRREIEGEWVIEGIRPVEGQMLDPKENKNFLWMVLKPVVGNYPSILVRPRFFFEKD
jgi:hypothetical protein